MHRYLLQLLRPPMNASGGEASSRFPDELQRPENNETHGYF